jgi:eukaryotic-like serine/threonine-protein kinase
MAAALEAFLAGTAVPGVGAGLANVAGAGGVGAAGLAGAAGAAGAGAAGYGSNPTTASATARANPNAIPYVPEAYEDDPRPRPSDPYRRTPAGAGGGAGRGRPPARPLDEEDEPSGTSPAVWAAGIVALLILAAVAFLVFRLLSGGGAAPVAQVTVPNFVNQTLTQAQAIATQNGLVLSPTASAAPSGVTADTVLAQNPAAGAKIDKGGTVNLIVAAGAQTVAVPDLRNQTEIDAFNLLSAAGLTFGPKTEAFDPLVPAGSVISQSPPAGVLVNKGTPISYVLSKGPEPSPSIAPSASPSPSPTPSPTPTPPPTPPPTAAPTPAPIPVGDYVCATVADAKTKIVADGFTVGPVLPTDNDAWFVNGQAPNSGTSAPPKSQITITTQETKPGTCP